MNKKLIQIKSSTLKKKLRNGVAILLSVLLITGTAPLAQVYAAESDEFTYHEITLTEEQFAAFEAVQEFNSSFAGLVGFEDQFALSYDSTPTNVIVFFESNPAPTQVIEAAIEGYSLSMEAALQIVEDEHTTFRNELISLFGSARARTAADYHINIEYRHALNGVAMTLPANMVESVAEIGVVRAIFPDFPVEHPEIIFEDEDEEIAALLAFAQYHSLTGTIVNDLENAWGNFQGRTRMNAHELHRRGYTGEGIIVAVLDTGVDWMHPTFAGSFPNASVINEARMARFGPGGTAANAGSNPALFAPLTQAELFNINVYTYGPNALPENDPRHMAWANSVEYRTALLNMMGHPRAGEAPEYVFLGRDNMRLWPEGRGECLRGNPIRPGIDNTPQSNGAPFRYLYPQTLPAGIPGNNPFEFSPLWHTTPQNQNMLLAHGLLCNNNATGAAVFQSNHGTHVAGTILGRPYGDTGRTLMGVAPSAYGIHYRVIWGSGGSSLDSVIVSGMEWAYLDGANVVNMSLGGMLTGSVCVRSLSVNNIKLADPTIVFTISAGNAGQNFFQIGNPSGSSMAISVAWLTELFTMGFEIDSPDFTGVSTTNFTTARDLGRVSFVDGNFIINHPVANVAHDNGNYRIFAMPEEGEPHATIPVGQGTVEDFEELYYKHGANLAGSFALVRRGQVNTTLVARAYEFGLAGLVMVSNEGQALLAQIGAAQGNGAANWNHNAIIIEMTPAQGAQWARNMVAGNGYSTFRFTGDVNINGGSNGVSNSSSRGPIDRHTFEIKPEIGAHGGVVHSANARHSPVAANANFEWAQADWQNAVVGMSGTSMSAPHAAGAVALMQQYSRDNNLGPSNLDGMWPNYEIKTRLMNTAMQLPGNLSPFDGGRQIDVWAATQVDTVVAVAFDRIATDLFVPFEAQDHASTYHGSFSFGGFNRHDSHTGRNPDVPAVNGVRNIGHRAGSYTLRAYIHNNSASTITYTIASEMLGDARAARPAGTPTARITGAEMVTLTHVSSLSVPAGGSAYFDVTMNFPVGSALGFHEGSVTVTGGSQPIILPVAAVMHAQQRTFTFEGLYRPVITTNTVEEGAQNMTSNELIMYFTHGWGGYLDLYLIRGDIVNAEGFTGDNWNEATLDPDGRNHFRFADYIMGTTMGTSGHQLHGRSFFTARGLNPAGQPEHMRGVIFDGYYWPNLWQAMEGDRREYRRLDEEGEFFIGINVFRQSQVGVFGNSNWFWDDSFLVPFSVDNTPPVFNSITINDVDVDLMQRTAPAVYIEPMTTFNEELEAYSDYDLVITGNVFDEWIAQAAIDGATFGVWNEHLPGSQLVNPFAQVNKPNNLALWVLAGDNEEGNRPIRANVEANGDFSVTLHGALVDAEVELRFWLIDGYAPVPVVNQVPVGQFGNTNPVPVARTLSEVAEHFELDESYGLVSATGLAALLRSDRIFGVASGANINHFAWTGLNVTEFSITANWTPAPAAVFGLRAFNNGNDDNASLAQAGLIRIWTQLDGVSVPVPSADLEVAAVLPDGTCAMEFIRVNHMWENPGYVNLIDANKNAPWQIIYLTVTLNGQTVELTLINNRFTVAPVFSLQAFNNGTDTQVPSLAGSIRIWTRLDGENTRVPYAGLTVSATLLDGTCAMEFVNVNRIWNDQDNVNLIDVNKNAQWQYINFSATLFGQTVDLALINNRYVPSTIELEE